MWSTTQESRDPDFTWSPCSLLPSGLLSMTQGSKDFSTKTPLRTQNFFNKEIFKMTPPLSRTMLSQFSWYLVFQLHLPCALLSKSEEDMLSEVFLFSFCHVTLFSFFLPCPVQVILQHDAHLPLVLHVSDEGMLQQGLSGWTMQIMLYKATFNKI